MAGIATTTSGTSDQQSHAEQVPNSVGTEPPKLKAPLGPPSYPDATKIAQAFVKSAPERLVWGSDWPHPGLPNNNKPDDSLLFDLMTEWAPDEATRNRILVRNPEALYGFPKAA